MIYYIFFIILLASACWCAWQISVADWRRRIIPDAYLWPLMLAGLLITAFFPWTHGPRGAAIGAVFGYAMAALIGFVFDYFMHRKKTDADTPIGMGDIKLMGVGGIWLGTSGLAGALVVACIAGALWSWRRKQKYIPFAPFFIVGAILTLIAMFFLL